MSMTRQEVLRAYADEKDVQFNYAHDGWTSETLTSMARRADDYKWEPERWRLKPVPVPPGDLTAVEARELFKSGVAVQWQDYSDRWITQTNDTGWSASLAWRRKPTPRMVPLGPEDVKGGDMVRNMRFSKGWSLIVGARGDHSSKLDGVLIVGIDKPLVVEWVELRDEFEISRDGGKTWAKCEKEVAE